MSVLIKRVPTALDEIKNNGALKDNRFIAGAGVAGGVGSYASFQLRNLAASGKYLMFKSILLSADVVVGVHLRHYGVDADIMSGTGTPMVEKNKRLDGPDSVAAAFQYKSLPTQYGLNFITYALSGGYSPVEFIRGDYLLLPPGESLVLQLATTGVIGFHGCFDWEEIPV